MPNLLPLPLTLGWPTFGATQSDGGTDVGENHGVTEDSNGEILVLLSNAKSSISAFGSPDTTRATPQACEYQTIQIERHTYVHAALLSPSYILEGIQQSNSTPKPTIYHILISTS